MARKTKLGDQLRRFVREVETEVAQKAAKQIVKDLKMLGPYWTGEFEAAWEVRPGNQDIPGDQESSLTASEKWTGWSDGTFPFPRRITPVEIPRLGAKQHNYTIGNRMKYRDYALDLIPGRFEVDKSNTAGRNWYLLYLMGGGLQNALRQGTNEASKMPKFRT